jgi:D-serine deaminase-like pyridoxal phosphate-dependent protein
MLHILATKYAMVVADDATEVSHMGSPDIDPGALAAIRDERVDWRDKGLPAAVFGQTIGEVAEAGLDLFADGFVGPLVVLDDDALTHNLTTMAQWCARHGMSHAPHGKTTMAPQLFARQLALGAWGITAANVSQLRVYRAFGVRRVQFANELVDPAGLRWLAGELARDPDFEFLCWVDSVAGVELMTAALLEAQVPRPVDVLVELGAVGGRSGVRDLETGRAVGAAVAASPVLRLAGVAGYEGVLGHTDGFGRIVDYLGRLRALTVLLAADGRFADVPEVMVSAGGSAYFDQVATVLGQEWPAGLLVRPMLRGGAYVSHDDGFYRDISPLGRSARLTDAPPLRPAFRAWAQVMSRPEPGLALLTLGKRDVSFDEGLPEPQLVRTATGEITKHLDKRAQYRVSKVSDQHAFVVPSSPSGTVPVAVGDWVGLGLSHPCTVFDKWRLIPVVRDTRVVDLIRTYF